MEQTEKLILNLTLQDIQTVIAGLGKLPAETSFNVILDIRDQVSMQQQTSADVAEKQED